MPKTRIIALNKEVQLIVLLTTFLFGLASSANGELSARLVEIRVEVFAVTTEGFKMLDTPTFPGFRFMSADPNIGIWTDWAARLRERRNIFVRFNDEKIEDVIQELRKHGDAVQVGEESTKVKSNRRARLILRVDAGYEIEVIFAPTVREKPVIHMHSDLEYRGTHNSKTVSRRICEWRGQRADILVSDSPAGLGDKVIVTVIRTRILQATPPNVNSDPISSERSPTRLSLPGSSPDFTNNRSRSSMNLIRNSQN